MAFIEINKTGKVKRRTRERDKVYASGIVYLMRVRFDDGLELIKIGVTGRSTVYERLSENVIALFHVYRYIPRTSLLKFSRCKDYLGLEKYLHDSFSEKRFTFPKTFQGHTEYFMISEQDEDRLIELYQEGIKLFNEEKDKSSKKEREPLIDPITGEVLI